MPGVSSDSADARYGNIWECYLREYDSHTCIEYSIYNMRSKAINLDVYIYVLYQKVL